MRAIGGLLLVLLAGSAPAAAAQRSLDAEAITAYRDGDLDTARSLWLELLEAEPRTLAGAERARVLYNLGNVAIRHRDDLEAVGWYTASLRLRPRDPDARSNLEFARLGAGLPPADRGDLSATVQVLLSSLTRAEAGWLALFALTPLALAFLLEALRGGRRWRWATLGAAALALLGSLPLWYTSSRAAADPLLVIAPEGTTARAEPRGDADPIETVDAGGALERIDAFPGWYRVELGRGRSGWIAEGDAFALKR